MATVTLCYCSYRPFLHEMINSTCSRAISTTQILEEDPCLPSRQAQPLEPLPAEVSGLCFIAQPGLARGY